MRRIAVLAVPWGSIVMVSTPKGLSQLVMTKRRGRTARTFARRLVPEARHDPDLLGGLQRELSAYLGGSLVRFSVRLDLSGVTAFQRQVLKACAKIPYGRTVTYGELARRVGRAGAARAVGAAMARNPVPIVIPCHRVIAANGSLGGFSAEQGVALKRRLLELEARAVR
jgi:methylated-DNA-[protein]-cysteine S-methyltransferase